MIFILDPSIYEMTDEQKGDYNLEGCFCEYFLEVINWFKNTIKQPLVEISNIEYGLIMRYSGHPFVQECTNLSTKSYIKSLFNRFVKCCINHKGTVNLSQYNAAIPNSDCNFSHNTSNGAICYNEFLKHISYLCNIDRNYQKSAVLLGIINHKLPDVLSFSINENEYNFEPIKNIKYDKEHIENNNVILFSNGYRNWLLSQGTITPTLENPLPNSDLCKQYKDWQECEIERGQDYKIIYRKAVHEVALRNNYHFNERLTNLNSNSGVIRDIYTSNSKPVIHISADVRHGRIEVFNSSGEHQGEYSYIGEQKSHHIQKEIIIFELNKIFPYNIIIGLYRNIHYIKKYLSIHT